MLNIDFTGAPAEKNSGRPATEVVRVIDVILDDTHPMYKDLGETLSLNSILYRPISDSVDLTDEGDTEYTGQAFPLDPNIKTLPLATYQAVFFDYVIKNGTNLRAGTVTAVHDGSNVEFTDTSTKDLGNTSGVTLSVDISGTNLRLRATTTSNNWTVKANIRGIKV